MKYTPPTNSKNIDDKYIDATPSTPGSNPPAAVFNEVQAEILNAIIAAGITPSHDDLTQLAAALAQKADKNGNFTNPLSETELGLTSTDKTELKADIAVAATSGRIIGHYWFGKTKADTVVPAPTSIKQNYYDFCSNTPYKAVETVADDGTITGFEWMAETTVVPPTDADVKIKITSKFWDIPEQTDQQGGDADWAYSLQKWGYYPRIVSLEAAKQFQNRQAIIQQNLTNSTAVNCTPVHSIHRFSATNLGAATITLSFDDDAGIGSGIARTYEIHIAATGALTDITWNTSDGDIHWLEDSAVKLQKLGFYHIFVFRRQNGIVVGNFGGVY